MTQAALAAAAILAGGGVILFLVGRWLPARWSAWFALAFGAAAVAPFLLWRGGPLEMTLFRWIPAVGWPTLVAYRFDALSFGFALLAGSSALLLLLWMAFGAPAEEGHFAPWVLLLLALFLHLLCSADLLLAYAGWEVLLLATYSLLIFRRSALPTPGIAEWFLGGQHLAGYVLVFALLVVGYPNGTLLYARLNPEVVTPLVLLLLLGTAWVRTAQVPFQGWAMAVAETPGPVSTLLLGSWGLLAGPYLWLRLASRAAEHAPREVALVAGSISLVIGAVLALRQDSARQVQAGDTVSRLGLVWIALGLDGPIAVAAGLFLLAEFLLGKVVFHAALSSTGGLEYPVRRSLFAVGAWGSAGLPPSLGFVGRWLLVLGLVQSSRIAYLPVVLLSTPLALAYLWRGWTLLPREQGPVSPMKAVLQRVLAVLVALTPLGGLGAYWLWQWAYERAVMVVVGTAAVAVRPFLSALRDWAPAWGLMLVLCGGVVAWWSGALHWRAAAAGEATDATEGPIREPLPVLPSETAWLAWVGRPVPLYQLFGRLVGHVVAAFSGVVAFLERHTVYSVLVVLTLATLVLIVLTR